MCVCTCEQVSCVCAHANRFRACVHMRTGFVRVCVRARQVLERAHAHANRFNQVRTSLF